MQQRHRVVDHAERRARDALQHLTAAIWRVDRLVPAGLDQYLPTHGLGALADARESIHKRIECLVGHTVVSNAVLRIGTTGLGANRTAAEHLSKVQARLVLGKVIRELLSIGRRQILITAEHGDRNARLIEHRTQMVGELAGQTASIDSH